MGNLMKSKPKLLGNLGVLPEHFPVKDIFTVLVMSSRKSDVITSNPIFTII